MIHAAKRFLLQVATAWLVVKKIKVSTLHCGQEGNMACGFFPLV